MIVVIRKQEPLTLFKVLGLLFAFTGVITIRNFEEFSLSNKTFLGDILVLINSFSISLFISFSRDFLRRNTHWWVTTWMFLIGGLQISLFSMTETYDFVWPVMTLELGVSMFIAVIGATLLTYFLSNWALVHVDPGKVSFFIYLQPVAASIVAWAYLGEAITLTLLEKKIRGN